MKILKTQEDVITYKSASKFPTLLITEVSKSVSLVEQVREAIPSARACVILLDSECQKTGVLEKLEINNL